MAAKPVKYFMVDAFTDSAFKGNPAAVCILEEERDEKWLQAIATEFNISQTCYLIRITDSVTDDSLHGNLPPKFHLRWFTPVAEVQLCGHATLAAAHILFTYGLVDSNIIEFSTLSGILTAKRIPEGKANGVSNVKNGEAQESYLIELDFPAIQLGEVNSDDISSISKALNVASLTDIKIATSKNVLAVLPSGKDVVDFQPNFQEIQKCPGFGMIITAIPPAGSGFDFYSRYFCPKFGINEDPVCGSAHCALAVYWAQKLGKSDLIAYQASPRSGILNIHVDETKQRVLLRGKAIATMEAMRDSNDYDNDKLTDSENAITDVLALPTTAQGLLLIPDFPFSCVKTAFLRGLAKDVVGLAAFGRANESIPSIVSSKFNTPRYFAVCLSGSRSNPGVAFFGSKGPYKFSPNVDLSKNLTYTPLLFNPVSASIYTYWLPSYEYYIGLTGIKVNEKLVQFNASLLPFEPVHGGGGTKISTSTTYALLQTSIYKVFAAAFVKESAAFKMRVTSPVKPFGVCYAAESVAVTPVGPAVPMVDLVMEKGKVMWRMNGRNSMVRIKKNGVDAWCLGFVDGGVNPRTPIVIGGLQMEDQLLQFDLENYRLGFSSSLLLQKTACSNFNFTSNHKNLLVKN